MSRRTARAGAALAGAAALLALGSAGASEPFRLRPGMGGLADPGAITCGYLNSLYEGGPTGFRQMLLYWTEGYLYGQYGKTLDQVLATAPGGPWTFDTLTDRLVDFCVANPDAPVPASAEALERELKPAP